MIPETIAKRHLKNLPIAIILPAVFSVILFIMTIFLLMLPTLETALMAQRRGLIHELTETALGTIDLYYQKQLSGELSEQAAQAQALAHVRRLRYGPGAKDYFWINDMTPRMLMHPYRTDLEGEDVSNFTDPNGKSLFVEIVRVVRDKGGGLVDYQWQWMDDPSRIVPKISFVKPFAPWGWVVGTGIYTGDIQAEISLITKKITLICLGILLLVFLLSGVIIWQAVKVGKKRFIAEQSVRLQRERLYRAGKMATVGTLAAGVAHEINNPVTAILLNAPILKSLWQRLSPFTPDGLQETSIQEDPEVNFPALYARVPQLLDHIEDCAFRIKNIVNELKDFARISPPELNQAVSINTAVEKAVSVVATLIKKSTDYFSMNLGRDLPPFAGNTQKVEQVIVNLLVNACQALENRNQIISISTQKNDDPGTITVIVRDTGVGIPDNILERIKDPFFTTKQTLGSTGLGLAISDRIMKDHGGSLTFKTTPEEGTLAIISFPATEKPYTLVP